MTIRDQIAAKQRELEGLERALLAEQTAELFVDWDIACDGGPWGYTPLDAGLWMCWFGRYSTVGHPKGWFAVRSFTYRYSLSRSGDEMHSFRHRENEHSFAPSRPLSGARWFSRPYSLSV